MGLTRKRKRGGNRNETLFPKKIGVDYSKLQMTPEGEYSITKRKDGDVLIRHMKSVIKGMKQKTIADLTGNVGGDTILFALNFKKVYSYEIDSENFDALQNNVEVFELPNVELQKGDSTKLYDGNTDVLYIDAPWGGPEYKEKKDMDLFLGSERIDLYVQKIMKKEKYPSHVFLKLPANYNFDRFSDFETKRFRIRGFYLLALFAA
jgi:predicted RNA methylase